MNNYKHKHIYMNVLKADRLTLLGKVRVYLNGKHIEKCISAKNGKNGFVEYFKYPRTIKNDNLITIKQRGNVKISFNLCGKNGI